MLETSFADRSPRPTHPYYALAFTPLELWRMRGTTDEIRGLAIETSFGHAFGLELDHELVLLHLQPSTEVLVAYADRIEAALLAQGWQLVEAPPLTTKERS